MLKPVLATYLLLTVVSGCTPAPAAEIHPVCNDYDTGVVYTLKLPASPADPRVIATEALRIDLGGAPTEYALLEIDATAVHPGIIAVTPPGQLFYYNEYGTVMTADRDAAHRWIEANIARGQDDPEVYGGVRDKARELMDAVPEPGGVGYVIVTVPTGGPFFEPSVRVGSVTVHCG